MITYYNPELIETTITINNIDSNKCPACGGDTYITLEMTTIGYIEIRHCMDKKTTACL